MQDAGRHFRPFHLTLIQKIAAGYLLMAIFTSTALIVSYLELHSINQTARHIATRDIPIIGSLIKARGSLLAQEGYAGKYAIFKDPAFAELFRQRERDTLEELTVVESASGREPARLRALYADYHAASELFFRDVPGAGPRLTAAGVKLLDAIDDLYNRRQTQLQAVLQRSNRQQESAMKWTVAICAACFLLAIGVAPVVTYRTFVQIRELQRATHRIAEGDFEIDADIEGNDEVSALARDFGQMAERLKVLEQMNLDASPLTRLPGNIAIERELDERLESGTEFAFCYADLDNFKPFSDRYGYAKGSELLRVTGDLIEAAVRGVCGEQGFVGHVGGDDFVMVVPPAQASAVCEEVIDRFDREVVTHFNEEDRKAGGIAGTDRYGVHRFFPITTISLAVIICGGARFNSAVDIARAAAEVKDTAKERPGSSYLISRQEHVT